MAGAPEVTKREDLCLSRALGLPGDLCYADESLLTAPHPPDAVPGKPYPLTTTPPCGYAHAT